MADDIKTLILAILTSPFPHTIIDELSELVKKAEQKGYERGLKEWREYENKKKA